METNIYTAISTQPLDILAAARFIADDAHGGISFFQGSVRHFNLGRHVMGVSYDVFEPLAINSFNHLCAQALSRWQNQLKIYMAHAKGRLNVGDLSVLIAVSAPHRDEAFKACRFLIEGIKHNSPIWKQEHYTDGNSEWIQGHALCQHQPTQLEEWLK